MSARNPPVPRPTAPAPSSGPAGDETAHLLRPKIRQAPSLTSPPHPPFRRSRRLPSIPGSPRRTRRSTATPATTSSTSAFTTRHDHSPERNPPNRAARLCVTLRYFPLTGHFFLPATGARRSRVRTPRNARSTPSTTAPSAPRSGWRSGTRSARLAPGPAGTKAKCCVQTDFCDGHAFA